MNENKTMGSFVDETSQSSLPSSSHFVAPDRDSLSRLFEEDLTAAQQNRGDHGDAEHQQMWKIKLCCSEIWEVFSNLLLGRKFIKTC